MAQGAPLTPLSGGAPRLGGRRTRGPSGGRSTRVWTVDGQRQEQQGRAQRARLGGDEAATPWGTIAAVAVVVLLAVGVFGYGYRGEPRPRRTTGGPGQVHAVREEPGPVAADRRHRHPAVRGRPARDAGQAGRLHPQPAVRRRARRLLGRLQRRRLPDRRAQREPRALPGARRGLDRLQPGPGQRRRAEHPAEEGRRRALHGDVALPGPRLPRLAAVVGPPAQGRRRRPTRASTSSSRR